MIQKNRIMTKKGIIIFDRNIDVEKTQENGKKVCEAYANDIYDIDYHPLSKVGYIKCHKEDKKKEYGKPKYK